VSIAWYMGVNCLLHEDKLKIDQLTYDNIDRQTLWDCLV